MLRAYISPSLGEHSIDGIFTSSDHLATIVREELEEMGKTGAGGYPDYRIRWSAVLKSGETKSYRALRSRLHEIAKEAVRCLNELIANGKTEGNTKIPVSFQEG